MVRRGRFGLRLATVLLMGSLALTACSSTDEGTTVTVTHGEVPAPTLVDNGVPGNSVGDTRLFRFDGTDEEGEVVHTDWVMTTTALDVAPDGFESRVATGVFAFGDVSNQLILEGAAFYPAAGATLKPSASTIRSIIGGSGTYAGATGWVKSTHLDDGTWTHVFHIQ